MKHVVQFSFGLCSWCAAKRVVAAHGAENTLLLFADTRYEDDDTYAWGRAAAKNTGAALVEIADGRDIWEVFKKERYIGNSRADPCSKILKRELCDRWMDQHYTPDTATRYVGIHFQEEDRLTAIRERLSPWRVEAPMCEKPLMFPQDMQAWAEREGLWVQRLYAEGFAHANCGGRCVKAGQAQWRLLLLRRPESYREEERKEEELRQYLQKDVAILRCRRGGNTKGRPLTLREFRERIEENQKDYDATDFTGCNCFMEGNPQQGDDA